jgi:restriction endonuclease S subunit
MKDETEEEQYEEGVVVKTLGQVCSIDYGTRIVRKDNVEGEYPVYGSGRAMFSTQTFNREGFNILVGRFALSLECVRFVNEKIFLNDSGLSVKPKTDILLHKYIGYYLLHNQNIIYNCARGTAQKNIEMDIFKSIKIPIPSLERQQDIVKYLDFIYEKANKTSNEKIAELKQLNEFCLSNQKIFGDNVVKTLRELCNFLPKSKRQASYGEKHGEYPFYTSSQSCSKYCDEYDYEDESLIIGTGGNANIKYSSKFSCSTDNFVIKINPGQLVKYIYYYLSINIEVLQKGFIGVGLQHISKEYINNIKIQIPSLERQKEIVEYCEYNDTLIKQLQKEIENNKKQAQQFIAGIVKVQVQTEEQSDTSSVNIQPIDEVKNEIVSVEEEVVIEPKPKVKKNVKKSKKEKKIIVIVEEDNEV